MIDLFHDFTLLGQVLLFFKALLSIVGLYFLGSFFNSGFRDNISWNIGGSILLGIVVISCAVAIYKTSFETQLLPIIALLIVLLVYKRAKIFRIGLVKRLNIKFIITCLLIFLVLFSFNSCISYSISGSTLTLYNDDASVYSSIAYDLYYSGKERFNSFDIAVGNGHELYHYLELWLTGFGADFFNIRPFIFFSFILKPILLSILFLFLDGFRSHFFKSSSFGFLLFFIPILTSIPPFLSYFKVPWYLYIGYRNLSMVHYIGCQPLMLFLIWCFINLISGSKNLGLIGFAFVGVINPLLIGIAPLTLALLIAVEQGQIWLQEKKLRFFPKDRSKLIALFIAIFIAIYGWIISDMGNNQIAGERESMVHNLFIAGNIFIRLLIGTALYCSVFLIGWVKAKDFFQSRQILLFLVVFTFSSFLFYSFFRASNGGNMDQIIFVVWNVPVILIGFIGLLKFFSRKPNKFYSIQFAALCAIIFWGVFNTFFEIHSSFANIYPWNHNGTSLVSSKIECIRERSAVLGSKVGYFNTSGIRTQRPINVSELPQLSALIPGLRFVRLNHQQYDIQNETANVIYRKSHMKRFADLLDNDESEVPAMANQYKINWIYADTVNHKIPGSVEEKLVLEDQCGDVGIYTVLPND